MSAQTHQLRSTPQLSAQNPPGISAISVFGMVVAIPPDISAGRPTLPRAIFRPSVFLLAAYDDGDGGAAGDVGVGVGSGRAGLVNSRSISNSRIPRSTASTS